MGLLAPSACFFTAALLSSLGGKILAQIIPIVEPGERQLQPSLAWTNHSSGWTEVLVTVVLLWLGLAWGSPPLEVWSIKIECSQYRVQSAVGPSTLDIVGINQHNYHTVFYNYNSIIFDTLPVLTVTTSLMNSNCYKKFNGKIKSFCVPPRVWSIPNWVIKNKRL